MKLSALVVVHNEEERIAACLEKLSFADEIVVVLDKCTDNTKQIAEKYTSHFVEGSWDIEGDRRNKGIESCNGKWILEVDADEHIPEELAKEILETIETTEYDWHELLVDNYVGKTRIRYGTGASYSKAAYPGLFKKTAKKWGTQRVHPSLEWSGRKGPMLRNRVVHYVDRNISDMIIRLDKYTTARARDMRENGIKDSFINNIRRLFSRFIKCYIARKGYREGGYGFLFAVFAGLYPLISYLKATLEGDD